MITIAYVPCYTSYFKIELSHLVGSFVRKDSLGAHHWFIQLLPIFPMLGQI